MPFGGIIVQEHVEVILKQLGIEFVVGTDNSDGAGEGSSWQVTMPPPGGWTKRYECRDDVAAWLVSWGGSEYSEYLAIQHFRDELRIADVSLLKEIESWLTKNVVTDRVTALREAVDNIVLLTDLQFLPTRELTISILSERIGRPYLSLGDRMLDCLRREVLRREGLEFDSQLA